MPAQDSLHDGLREWYDSPAGRDTPSGAYVDATDFAGVNTLPTFVHGRRDRSSCSAHSLSKSRNSDPGDSIFGGPKPNVRSPEGQPRQFTNSHTLCFKPTVGYCKVRAQQTPSISDCDESPGSFALRGGVSGLGVDGYSLVSDARQPSWRYRKSLPLIVEWRY